MVPNCLLEQSGQIFCYLVENVDGCRTTFMEIAIDVAERARPEDYIVPETLFLDPSGVAPDLAELVPYLVDEDEETEVKSD